MILRLAELRDPRMNAGPDSREFEFPTTDVVEARHAYKMQYGEVALRDVGLLSISGYHVGATRGLPAAERRRLLNYVFLRDDLGDVDDRSYAAEWGTPMASERLQS